MSTISAVQAKLSSVENDYQQIIAKKDEQLRMQDERMSKQREEILRLRAELEAEKGEVPHCIADKEKADDESEEAESDRKFRTRQQEFRDVLNRYEPGFPLKYKKSITSSFTGESPRFLASRNQDRLEDHLFLKDQVARPFNHILAV